MACQVRQLKVWNGNNNLIFQIGNKANLISLTSQYSFVGFDVLLFWCLGKKVHFVDGS